MMRSSRSDAPLVHATARTHIAGLGRPPTCRGPVAERHVEDTTRVWQATGYMTQSLSAAVLQD